MFKNAQIYRISPEWKLSREELEASLASRSFSPCATLEKSTAGWVAPAAAPDQLVHEVDGKWLVTLCEEFRMLPSSVVKQEAEERAVEIEEQQGFRPGRKQMKELREQVEQELLPRAFTRRRHTRAWIDVANGWLAIDAPSRSKAESVLEVLNNSLETFPVTLTRTQTTPVAAMTDWLAGEEAPEGFSIDQDCELRAITEDKATVKYARHTLEGDDIRMHLEAGKLPVRLAMTFNDRISFVLTENLEIKRITFLDLIQEALDESGAEDAEALLNAEFALVTAELGLLFDALVQAMEGLVEKA